MKRFRAFLESIAFAGLKPDVRSGQPLRMKWLGRLQVPLDRLLSGRANQDPLYLTNRTLGQKIRAWTFVAVPCLFVVGAVALTLSKDYFDPPETAAPKELTPEEVSRKILPNLRGDIHIDSNREADVVEVHVEPGAPLKLTGSVRNNSAKQIGVVDVVFILTDNEGSQVGAVTARIENLAPNGVKAFQFPIQQQNAAFALVREVNPLR